MKIEEKFWKSVYYFEFYTTQLIAGAYPALVIIGTWLTSKMVV